MSSYSLRILHISDLHERVELERMSPERKAQVQAGKSTRHRVLGANFHKVLSGIRSSHPPDLVCFTGDAADWGLTEEFSLATERLDSVLSSVGVSQERLFLVPGNHDIDQRPATRAWKGLRGQVGNRSREIADWMAGMAPPGHMPPTWRDDVLSRSAAYRNWVTSDLVRPDLLPTKSSYLKLGYRRRLDDLELPFPIHIIGLDSAWLCGDRNDQGKLLLTGRQVDILTTDGDGRQLPGFRLALVHHPLDYLIDQFECQRTLSDNVDLLLHGHQHTPLSKVERDPDRRLHTLAAGSLYEGDAEDKWINGFQLIDVTLDDQGRVLGFDLEFWGWSKSGYYWHLDGSIYQEASDGRLKWPTVLSTSVASETDRAGSEAAGRPETTETPAGLTDTISSRFVHLPRNGLFVGRDNELKVLQTRLQEQGWVLLHGLPGIGKTWTATELLHRSGYADRCIHHAYQSGENFIALWNAVLPAATSWGSDVSADEILSHILELISDQGALLILDNVEYLDGDNSVGKMMPRLMTLANEHRLKLIVASRMLPRIPEMYAQASLGGLSYADSIELFARHSVSLPESTVRRLYDALGGNPFALMLAAERIREAPQPNGVISRIVKDAEAAAGVTSMVLSLDPESERVLTAAAVFAERGASSHDLANITDIDTANVERAMEIVPSRGFGALQSSSNKVMHVVLNREVALHLLSRAGSTVEKELRKAAAKRLNDDHDPLSAAEQLQACGDCDAAISVLYPWSEKLIPLPTRGRLEAVLLACTTGSPAALVQRSILLGRIRVRQGDPESANVELDAGRLHLPEVMPTASHAALWGDLYDTRADALLLQGHTDALVTDLEEALAKLDEHDHRERGMLLAKLGLALLTRGDKVVAAQRFEEALLLLEAGPALALANVCLNLSDIYHTGAASDVVGGDPLGRSVTLLRQAQSLYELIGDRWGLVDLTFREAIWQFDAGKIDQAAQVFQRNIEHAQSVGSVRQSMQNRLGLAAALIQLGRLDEAEQVLTDEVIEIALTRHLRNFAAAALSNRAEIALYRRNWEQAGQLARKAQDMADTYDLKARRPNIQLILAMLSFLTGDVDDAFNRAQAAARLSRETSSAESEGIAYRVLGLVEYRRGSVDSGDNAFDASLNSLSGKDFERARTYLAWARSLPEAASSRQHDELLGRARDLIEIRLGLNWEVFQSLEQP